MKGVSPTAKSGMQNQMKIAIIIYDILAALLALASIGYVVSDIIIEYIEKKKAANIVPDPEVIPEPEPEVIPEPEPEIVEEMPDTVEQIDAEKADEMISDDLAMSQVFTESGAGVGYKTYINIGTLDENFEANDVITLDVLKEKGLVNKKAQRIKILADGILTKPFTVKAESFSIQAVKMIELTGGTVVMLRQ